jgi:hypothetical protein
MDVLGSPVDPLSVVINGSRHLHAVHRGVCFDDSQPRGSEAKGRLAIETLDAPLVAPGDAEHLLNFDNVLPDLTGTLIWCVCVCVCVCVWWRWRWL